MPSSAPDTMDRVRSSALIVAFVWLMLRFAARADEVVAAGVAFAIAVVLAVAVARAPRSWRAIDEQRVGARRDARGVAALGAILVAGAFVDGWPAGRANVRAGLLGFALTLAPALTLPVVARWRASRGRAHTGNDDATVALTALTALTAVAAIAAIVLAAALAALAGVASVVSRAFTPALASGARLGFWCAVLPFRPLPGALIARSLGGSCVNATRGSGAATSPAPTERGAWAYVAIGTLGFVALAKGMRIVPVAALAWLCEMRVGVWSNPSDKPGSATSDTGTTAARERSARDLAVRRAAWALALAVVCAAGWWTRQRMREVGRDAEPAGRLLGGPPNGCWPACRTFRGRQTPPAFRFLRT